VTHEEYLAAILAEQGIESGSEDWWALQDELRQVDQTLSNGLPEASPTVEAAGSLAKDTLTRAAYDLDVVCYFGHEDTGAGETLKDIYKNVQDALREHYEVEPKKSALRITGLAEEGLELRPPGSRCW